MGERVPAQMHRQHDVCLLGDLLPIQVEIGEMQEQGVLVGFGPLEVPTLVLGEITRLPVDLELFVVRDEHAVCRPAPRLHLARAHFEPLRHIAMATDGVGRHRNVAKRLKVSAREVKAWRRAADRMFIPYDEELEVHRQASDFTKHQRWDFKGTKPDQYPLFLHFPYFDLYRKQVTKQADIVLAMHLRGDAFTHEQKARNFAYYEELTVRDSSLSSNTQSIIAAEVGHLQLAHDYLGEAALMDLNDLERNVRDGVHMGSLAGAWLAVVAGLGGMRHHGDALGFAPRLPPGIQGLSVRVTFLDRLIRVTVGRGRATYTLLGGKPIAFEHYGKELRLTARSPVGRPIPRILPLPEPKQPYGRAPARRGQEKPRELRPHRGTR